MTWKKTILIVLGAGLFAACLSIFLQTKSEAVQSIVADVTGEPKPVSVAQAAVGSGSSFTDPGIPERLIIPSIGVNANIQDVGLFWDGDGAMSIPTNFTDVAWYQDGPRPGQPGSAVIDGHLDGRNTPTAVFYNLGKLKVGGLVDVVDKDGTTLQFVVTGTATYAYNATTTDIFTSSAPGSYLNLITCAGDWIPGQNIYNERIVVFTELATSTAATSSASAGASS